jgi:hypothetical protein
MVSIKALEEEFLKKLNELLGAQKAKKSAA